MTFSNLTVSVSDDGAIGHLTLARPGRLNALSAATLIELAEAAEWFDARPAVKVVVVAGEGRAFCAGFDLDDFAGPAAAPAASSPAPPPVDTGDLGRLMADAIGGMAAVTVAAIQGHCVGGGVVLAAACDLRVAGRGAAFSIPEVDLGIPLAWGGIPRLVRELGPAVAKDLVLTCRRVGAEEAHALRFVNRVVDDDRVREEADLLAGLLASKSALTLRMTKQHVNAVAEEAGSTAESFRDSAVLAAARRDPESRAAAAAYLARRSRR